MRPFLAIAVSAAALRLSALAEPLPPTPAMYASAAAIISYINSVDGNRTAWDRLAYASDMFGPRFTGSDALNHAISWFASTAHNDGLHITEEPVRWLLRRTNAYINNDNSTEQLSGDKLSSTTRSS